MLTAVVLAALLQAPPLLPLPRTPTATAAGVGPDIERIARGLAGVVTGELPPGFELTDGPRELRWDEATRHLVDVVQTPPPVVIQPGDQIVIEFPYVFSPFRPVKFRLWLDGEIKKNFVAGDFTGALPPAIPVPATGTIIVSTKPGVVPPFTADQLGQHTFALTAYDAATEGGSPLTESKREDAPIPVEVAFTAPPPAPSGGKIVTIKLALAPDGTMRLLSVVTDEKK